MQFTVQSTLLAAKEDFRRARQQAAFEAIMARLQGQTAELLSYNDVYRQLKAIGQSDRGLQQIPVAAIVGSVGRTNDFSRTFLPRNTGNEERWANLLTLVNAQAIDTLPPIQVYQIGDAYFVQDGHHRVSIARRHGMSHIHAQVVEVHTRVPFKPDTRPDELIWRAEYAEFLEQSQLHEQRPEADLSVSIPGQYMNLAIHIEVHRYFQEAAREVDIPWPEAVVSWYDEAYLPLAEAIREQNLLRGFPGRTETDLYLWLVEHRLDLQRELHWELPPTAVAADLARQGDPARPVNLAQRVGRRVLRAVLPRSATVTGQWRRDRLLSRYSDGLFGNILVLVSGSPAGWRALEQAFALTSREQARIHGLHIASPHETAEERTTIEQAFAEHCFLEGATGYLAVESGDLADKVIQRTALNDLTVLALGDMQNDTAAPGISARCQEILRQASRPVLVITGEWSNLSRPLLIYDNNNKSQEALFAAAYMGEQWRVPVTLVAAARGPAARKGIDYARAYLEMHEVEAIIHEHERLDADLILQTAADLEIDFLIIGSYRSNKLATAVRGSRLNELLQRTNLPLLTCR